MVKREKNEVANLKKGRNFDAQLPASTKELRMRAGEKYNLNKLEKQIDNALPNATKKQLSEFNKIALLLLNVDEFMSEDIPIKVEDIKPGEKSIIINNGVENIKDQYFNQSVPSALHKVKNIAKTLDPKDNKDQIDHNRSTAQINPKNFSSKPQTRKDDVVILQKQGGKQKKVRSGSPSSKPYDGSDDIENTKTSKFKRSVQSDKPGGSSQAYNEKLMSETSENSSSNQRKLKENDIKKFEELATQKLETPIKLKKFKSMFNSEYGNEHIKHVSDILITKAKANDTNDVNTAQICEYLKHIILDKESGFNDENLKTVVDSQILGFSLTNSSSIPSNVSLPKPDGDLKGFKEYLSAFNIDEKKFVNLVKLSVESQNSFIYFTQDGIKVMDSNEAIKNSSLKIVEFDYINDYFKDKKIESSQSKKLLQIIQPRIHKEIVLQSLINNLNIIDNMILLLEEKSIDKKEEVYVSLQSIKEFSLKKMEEVKRTEPKNVNNVK